MNPSNFLEAFFEPDESGALLPRRHLFDEQRYLEINSDVKSAVDSGGFTSGFEHWRRRGKLENRPFADLPFGLPSRYSDYVLGATRLGPDSAKDGQSDQPCLVAMVPYPSWRDKTGK